jgi:hypothetical protein
MCQRRPADPTDPGDAADLSIMGYAYRRPGIPRTDACLERTLAQTLMEINDFLTTASIQWS